MELKDTIRRVRYLKGHSIADLADRLGVTSGWLTSFEMGKMTAGDTLEKEMYKYIAEEKDIVNKEKSNKEKEIANKDVEHYDKIEIALKLLKYIKDEKLKKELLKDIFFK